MLHIAICDDEEMFVDQLGEMISRYAVETETKIRVTKYYDGLDLIEKYDTTIDLIFLDIQMKMQHFILCRLPCGKSDGVSESDYLYPAK